MGRRLNDINLFEWLERNGMGRIFEKYRIYGKKRKKFLDELRKVDLKRVEVHRELLLSGKETPIGDVEFPREVYTKGDEPMGWESLQRGEWAEVILAGGAGTRFFSELKGKRGFPKKAKGLFPITPIANRSFLDLFISEALYYSVKSGKVVPVLIMVSSITEDEIKEWIERSELYGFPKEWVIVFRQKEHPRLDEEGFFAVNSDGSLFWAGDGHGGLYRALYDERINDASIIDYLKEIGVKNIVVHNVDNPLSRPLYPERLGLHIKERFLFTISCVEARENEKVGLLIKEGGKVKVIEYSVAPPSVRNLTKLGHINVNLISLDAIRSDIPPVIYRDKPVNAGRRTIMTSTMETLIQGLVELLPPDRVGIMLLDREQFFAPTKSVAGVDSVDDTRKLLLKVWNKLMELSGAVVMGNVEIHPSSGLCVDDLKAIGIGENWIIGKDAEVYISGRYSSGGKPFSSGLIVEDGASLKIFVSRPYGRIEISGRSVVINEYTSGKIRIGNNVRIKAKIEVKVKGDGIFEIPDSSVIRTNKRVVVCEGEKVVLRN